MDNTFEINLIPREIEKTVSDVTSVTAIKNNDIDKTLENKAAVTHVTETTSKKPISRTIKTKETLTKETSITHIPYQKRPCWHIYDDWTLLDNGKRLRPGTYWLTYKGEKPEEIELQDVWICSPLHIDAQTLDNRSNNFGRFLRFKDTAERWKTWAMPMELLRGSGEEIRGTLLSMGVIIDPTKFREMSRYLLQTTPPSKNISCSLQTGWHGRRAYILPDKVIGPEADKVVFQSNQAAYEEFNTTGDLQSWQKGVSKMAIHNPMLILGLSCAFVGPLLMLTNSEGGGVHMVGDSSSGKSTIARAASSIWGGKEYRRSWRTTANGLEAAAALFNDGLIVLDEISECDPKDVGEIAYSLGNGCGKQRANRHGGAKSLTCWLCFPLSNGERTISTAIKEGGGRVKSGQSMRLLDLPIKRQYGAWDNLHKFSNGAAFADHISSEALKNYGHAGRYFLKRLTYDDRDFCKVLNDMKSQSDFCVDGSQGQEKRAAGRFSLIAVAGELATEYGITCWPIGAATEAAIIGYQSWRAQRGEGNEEKHQIFNALQDFIERHGDSRFSDMDITSNIKTINNRAGYWRDENDIRTYYLISDGMNEALKGFDLKLALNSLEQSGIIPPANSKGERSKAMRVNGKMTRLYKINFDQLSSNGNPLCPVQYPKT